MIRGKSLFLIAMPAPPHAPHCMLVDGQPYIHMPKLSSLIADQETRLVYYVVLSEVQEIILTQPQSHARGSLDYLRYEDVQ